MGTVTTFPVGAAALDALNRRLQARRGGDVLAPAHILSATPMMALGVRRGLGRRPGGIAGATAGTIRDFAFDLARPVMASAGVRLARRCELMAAIRAELRAEPGRFGAVADHRTTEERLLALSRDLSGLPPEAFDSVEAKAEGLAADAIRVVRAAVARLDGVGLAESLDELAELARESSSAEGSAMVQYPRSAEWVIGAALDALDRLPLGARGPLLLYLPDPIRPFEGRLAQAVARRADAEVLIGLTGHPSVDRPHLRRLSAWSMQADGPAEVPASVGSALTSAPTAATAATGNTTGPVLVERSTATVLDVADPEEEVRAALRDVAAHAAAGVPLTDLAVLYTSPEPYAELLADQLAAADLHVVGPGHRPLEATLAGRTLRRLLELAAHGLDRDAVMTLLAAAPIDTGDGHEPPVAWWDSLSRQAGVIDGEHWIPRLADLKRARLDEGDREQLEKLSAFVAELVERLAPPEEATWSSWSQWARSLLERYLLTGSTDDQDDEGWPEDESTARRMIERQLDDLASLDAIGVPPTATTFEATVRGDLASVRLPGRLQGPGLFVGPLSAVPGLSFERIVVVGLAEGRFPRVLRADSLLSETVRAGGLGMLAETGEATHLDIRAVALAVAASVRPALLLTARGDLRSNRSRTWPRVLDPLVANRQSLDSHHQGLLDHGRTVSADDLGLRSLVSHVDGNDPVHTHPLAQTDAVLAAALARRDNLERSHLTVHDGQVPARRVDPTEQLMSPTALETYAACPRKYLFQRVLRLSDDERPERIEEITARDRGTLMHHILERFVADALADDSVPQPGEPWPTAQRARLLGLMEEEVASAQARGITGGEVRTRLLRRRMHTELLNFLDTDDQLRAERGSTPYAVEYGFGLGDETTELVGTWAGWEMRLRGSIDRVDLTADGGLLVIDYKGGSGKAYAKLEDNPLNNGRRLQLPLYARAVAEKLGRSGTRTGLYWLTKENRVREMALDENLEADLEDAVSSALEGITKGLFPAVPGEAVGWPRLSYDNCRYCDFDRVCPTNRQGEWERVRVDPALAPISRLTGEDERSGKPT